MFPKNSAFSTSEDVDNHMESLRNQAAETHADQNVAQRRETERLAAYDMLKAAENLIDDEYYDEAGELVRRAAELLIDANAVPDN